VICSRDAGAATPLVVDGGLARLCLYLPDGQRVVAGFAFAGEVVGLAQPQPSMVVEAVTTTWTHEWSNGDDAVAIDEAQMLSAALSRAMAVLAMRSRHHAHARLAAFLVDLIDRGFGTSFALPIARSDIGDHLGLTVHTVSRILSDFKRCGLIDAGPSRILSFDRIALQAVADQGGQLPHLASIDALPGMVH